MILQNEFYLRTDVVQIAQDLLGKVLVSNIDNQITSGIIVETEAYAGIIDKASHAYGNRRTKRTETMYATGGVAYVYLCYGIHHLFNVVTNIQDIPHAVLIRAIEPLEGIEIMLERRGKSKLDYTLTAGPGALSEALNIKTSQSGLSLIDSGIFIEDRNMNFSKKEIEATTRVGVSYAREDALLPYRFFVKGNRFVSKGKGL